MGLPIMLLSHLECCHRGLRLWPLLLRRPRQMMMIQNQVPLSFLSERPSMSMSSASLNSILSIANLLLYLQC